MSVEVLCRDAELDDEVPREVLGLDLAAFLLPEADKRGFIVAHDDSGIGATDEVSAGINRASLQIDGFHVDAP
jgi:hypothetical protein